MRLYWLARGFCELSKPARFEQGQGQKRAQDGNLVQNAAQSLQAAPANPAQPCAAAVLISSMVAAFLVQAASQPDEAGIVKQRTSLFFREVLC